MQVGAVPHWREKIWMGFATSLILPSHSEGPSTVQFDALFVGALGIFAQVEGVGGIVMADQRLCQQYTARRHEAINSRFTRTRNAQANLGVYQRLLGPGAVKHKHLEPA